MPGNKSSYKILYSSDVVKNDLPRLDDRIKAIIRKKIEKLIVEPGLGLPLRGKLAKLYKLKVSKYRILYQIDNYNLTIIIIAIGKRENSMIYKLAEKRI